MTVGHGQLKMWTLNAHTPACNAHTMINHNSAPQLSTTILHDNSGDGESRGVFRQAIGMHSCHPGLQAAGAARSAIIWAGWVAKNARSTVTTITSLWQAISSTYAPSQHTCFWYCTLYMHMGWAGGKHMHVAQSPTTTHKHPCLSGIPCLNLPLNFSKCNTRLLLSRSNLAPARQTTTGKNKTPYVPPAGSGTTT